jgi:holo-[acyl-carrier protein] synthase
MLDDSLPSLDLPARLAVGIDLIEVERIAATLARFGARFLARVFTERELAIVGRNPVRLAGRFAAKEACAKALGTGIDGPRWREIECLRDASGKPALRLHGQAAARARDLGWHTLDVSISTTRRHGIALVVALAPPPDPLPISDGEGESD